MPTTLICSGVTFTNKVMPGLPAITNLRTIAFFGTGDDGNNGNRVIGGPTIVTQSGTPAAAANYMPLGAQSGRNDVLNTQNPRDAPTLAGGTTWCAACRVSQLVGVARGAVFADQNGTAIGSSWALSLSPSGGGQLYVGNVVRASIVQVLSPITNYHFMAMTYSGGAAGTFTAYDFTENPTTGVPVTYVASGQVTGAQSPHLGGISTETNFLGAIEHAFGLVAHSVINVTDLATIYQWTKANLARRGIAC